MKYSFFIFALVCVYSFSISATDICQGTMSAEPTWGEISERIKQCKPKSIEEFIGGFAAGTRANHGLIYKSRSLQSSSVTRPRIIFVSPNANVAIGIETDPQSKGYNDLEMFTFDKEKKKFEFREILFDKAGISSISDPNPSKCLACHQGKFGAKPIFDPFSAWGGFFGAKDMDPHPRERSAYFDFLESKNKEPGRFDLLLDPAIPEARYKIVNGANTSRRSLLRIGAALSHRHSEVIAKGIAASEKLRPFSYAFLKILNCGFDANVDFAKIIPSELLKKFTISYRVVEDESAALIKSTAEKIGKRVCSAINSLPYPEMGMCRDSEIGHGDKEKTISAIRYILKNIGEDLYGWPITLERDLITFRTGEGFELGGLDMFFWENVIDSSKDPLIHLEFKKKFPLVDNMIFFEKANSLTCKLFEKRSLEVLSGKGGL